VFKLGIEMTAGKATWFWIEKSKVNVKVRVNSNTAWVRTL